MSRNEIAGALLLLWLAGASARADGPSLTDAARDRRERVERFEKDVDDAVAELGKSDEYRRLSLAYLEKLSQGVDASDVRKEIEALPDAAPLLRRLQVLEAEPKKLEEDFAGARKELGERSNALATLRLDRDHVAELRKVEAETKRKIDALTEVVSGQKDPEVKARNEARLVKARERLAELSKEVDALAESEKTSLARVEKLTGESDPEQAIARLESERPLVTLWNLASRRLWDARDRLCVDQGLLVRVRGQVLVKTREGDARAFTDSSLLRAGDTITTLEGASVSLLLPTGKRLTAGPRTTVHYDGDCDLEKGLLRISNDVRRRFESPFKVRIQEAITSVRGSDVVFVAESGKLRCCVREGNATIERGDRHVDLVAGQKAEVTGESVGEARPVSTDEFYELCLGFGADIE
jgi:hypothetical protein